MSHERRVFLALSDRSQGAEILVPEQDAHHLRSVVRLRQGDPLTVVDSASGEVYPSFVADAGRPFIVKLGASAQVVAEPSIVTTLLFALCKNRVNDMVAEKATELGVDRIMFWQAERSVVRYSDDAERQKRAERLQKIAAEASKQSARVSVPEVLVVGSLSAGVDLLQQVSRDGDRYFYGSLAADARPLPELPPLKTSAHVLIGPEGDTTPTEEQLLRERRFEPFTLGSNRLRSETAACAAITAIDVFGRLNR